MSWKRLGAKSKAVVSSRMNRDSESGHEGVSLGHDDSPGCNCGQMTIDGAASQYDAGNQESPERQRFDANHRANTRPRGKSAVDPRYLAE